MTGRKAKKSIVWLMLVVFIVSTLQFSFDSEAATAGWKQDSKGWWYQFADGSYAKDEWIQGHYLNKKGYWDKKWDGVWKKNKTGWWFQAGSWYPKNQWLKISRKEYYFDAKGYMVTNRWIGQYYVNKDGVYTKKRSSTKPIVTPKTTQLKTPTYPSGSPAAKWGALQVKGTDLCSASGAKVQLKGVSTFGITWSEGVYNINQDAFKTIKGWGGNLIRIAVYTEESGGYCSDGNKATLDATVANAVSYASNLGMYVIIDWHILRDGNPKTHLTEAKQFFADMSYKYSNYDNVLYEICNEPNNERGNVSWADIKSYADTIIPIIRENDDDAVILVGTPNYSQNVDEVAANPVKQKKNVMYSLHFYAATHGDWLRNKLKTARSAGTPVFVTESNICDASGDGWIDSNSAAAWKKLINDNNISFVGWSLCNKNEKAAFIKNSCSKHSGWTDSDLTETGLYYKKWFQGK